MVYDLTNKAKFARNFSLKGQILEAYNHVRRIFALGVADRGLVEYLLAYEQGQNNITLNGEL